MFDRKIYFDSVRASLFGAMTQTQVDGQEAILTSWETYVPDKDVRWLAYMLATTLHETAQQMIPLEEYGKGQGMEYGKPDPETGNVFYGRGFVQLTWKENYQRATDELGLTEGNDLVWYPEEALDYAIAARIMYLGMVEGWFRSDSKGPQNLPRYFDFEGMIDDPYGAREIINGDKKTVPSWSNGVSIGNLVKDYHGKFLAALEAAWIEEPAPEPEPVAPVVSVGLSIEPPPTAMRLFVNGREYVAK